MKKPKLGQNFLVDENACQRIVDALGDASTRTVVEIGPGHGAITGLLAPRVARLHCIEFDPALARELTFRFRNDPHITIHHADILETDLTQFVSPTESDSPTSTSTVYCLPSTVCTIDVVGNLPYYITSEILLRLFAAARTGALSRAVVMMQREVGDRISAAPGSSEYGALTALTAMHAQVTSLFTLPPAAFNPPPDVYSTVLRLEFAPRFAELGVDYDGFNRFLRAGFAQKRKTLSNNLRNTGYTAAQLTAAWPTDLPPQARAEAVPLEAMAALYRGLREEVAEGKE
jgi:16S rRNA (adenine1518-N6/adenine1519-N6)-dimethyltransferase